jgi:PAS domain-containing protein
MRPPEQEELTMTLSRKRAGAAYDLDDEAALSTRVLISLGVFAYVAWHPLISWLSPLARDPFYERALLGTLCLTFVALSFIPVWRRYLELFVMASIYAGTFHHLSLVSRNDLSMHYLLAHFILLGALSPILGTLRASAVFLLSVTAGSGLAAAISGADLGNRVTLIVGSFILLTVTTASAWRSQTMQRAGRRQVKQVGQFFRNLVDVMPDPVYARSVDGDWQLTNNAFDRSLRSTQQELSAEINLAAPEVVAALQRTESMALATGHPMERDVDFIGLDGQKRVVSLKVGAPQLRSGEQIIVGLIRDVTASRQMEQSLKSKIEELERARREVKQLQGLLPICMHCGSIRADDGRWQSVEAYVHEHTEAKFSHGLCDTCLDDRYPVPVAK